MTQDRPSKKDFKDWPQDIKDEYISLNKAIESSEKGGPMLIALSPDFYQTICNLLGISQYWQSIGDFEILIDPDARAKWRLIPVLSERFVLYLLKFTQTKAPE